MALDLEPIDPNCDFCGTISSRKTPWDGLMVRIPVAVIPFVSRLVTCAIVGLACYMFGHYAGQMSDMEKLRYVETRIQQMTGEQSDRSGRKSGVDIGNRNGRNNVEQSRRDI